MEPDRQKARSTSRILLYVVAALLVVLAIALVGSCRESEVSDERVAPEDAQPMDESSGLLPDAAPLLRAA